MHLFKLKTYHEVVDEIYYQVKHLEPWERGSRKTAGQTGMCGGVSSWNVEFRFNIVIHMHILYWNSWKFLKSMFVALFYKCSAYIPAASQTFPKEINIIPFSKFIFIKIPKSTFHAIQLFTFVFILSTNVVWNCRCVVLALAALFRLHIVCSISCIRWSWRANK